MLPEITLFAVALLSWTLEFLKSPREVWHQLGLRLILLAAVIVAGGVAIINAWNEDKENEALRAQVAELAQKPKLTLVVNGREVIDEQPTVLTLSGGVYTLAFAIFNNSERSASDVTLNLMLPGDLAVQGATGWRPSSMSTVPSPGRPTKTVLFKNYYQRQLGGTLFPGSFGEAGQITFVESGEKTVTRSAFAVINSLESGRTAVSFDLDLRE